MAIGSTYNTEIVGRVATLASGTVLMIAHQADLTMHVCRVVSFTAETTHGGALLAVAL